VPKKGAINNIVIFIRFSDESEFPNPFTGYEVNFNSGAESMANYFKEASYNALTVTSYFYPDRPGSSVVSYQDAQPRNYYRPYNATTNPIGYSTASGSPERGNREVALLTNAVNFCSAQILADGLNLDGDDDGWVDNVCFIVYGVPDAWNDLLWAHMGGFRSVSVYLGTKRVGSYNLQLNGDPSFFTSGPYPSVLVHEMGHSLGAPDFYRYTDKSITPVGFWEVMAYNNTPPPHMTAYTKFKYMTWISSIPKITTAGRYTLNPLTSPTNNCYRIDSPNSTSEYFVVEYRKNQGFDAKAPGEGLVVYRVNTATTGNASGPPDELYAYRPGGTTTSDGVFGGYWKDYGKAAYSSDAGRTAINDATDPSCFLSGGGPGGLSIFNVGAIGSTISFNVGFGAQMTLSKRQLYFGATANGAATAPQSVMVGYTAAGAQSWTTASNQAWLAASPGSGAGAGVLQVGVNPAGLAAGLAAGVHQGTVTVTDPNAANGPQTINVTLTIYAAGASAVPFGDFATPLNGTTGIAGAIPVTGWVLDDIETASVQVKREPHATDPPGAVGPDGLVFIGDGLFVDGARPDVEADYPAYPLNNRAGWGYMLLTNFLPLQGNATFTLHAIATDKEGHVVTLGTKTINCDNAHATKPFGTIDTPAQGGIASGNPYLNFGWVLTPMPKTVPKNGSTIEVYVDSVKVGNLGTPPNVYDQRREDVAKAFPGLNNTDGAVGAYFLDATKYAAGVHTIFWIATDDEGKADGIGSRYFTIMAGVGAERKGDTYFWDTSLRDRTTGYIDRREKNFDLARRSVYPNDILNLPASFDPLNIKRGFDRVASVEAIKTGDDRSYHVDIKEVELLKIYLDPARAEEDNPPSSNNLSVIASDRRERGDLTFKKSDYTGYMIVGDELRPLPIGSTLDARTGAFAWLPGPGFIGSYDLFFVEKNAFGSRRAVKVKVTIKPKY